MLGPHLTLDMYNCDKDAVVSQELIFKVLDELPGYIGMHKITNPQIIPYSGNGSANSFDKGGISAFVLIAESHITIHTFKAQRHVFIDIFSCKDFDVDKAVDYLTLVFKPKKVEKNLFMRGRHFSKDLGKTEMVVRKQRTVKVQNDMRGRAMTANTIDI
jgi:S-adenosylmethionine decarboxylase